MGGTMDRSEETYETIKRRMETAFGLAYVIASNKLNFNALSHVLGAMTVKIYEELLKAENPGLHSGAEDSGLDEFFQIITKCYDLRQKEHE